MSFFRENAPAIIFIDEVDAIATKRFDAQTGADREVQRILMELLNQMDGFDQSVNVKASTLLSLLSPLFFLLSPALLTLSFRSYSFSLSLLLFVLMLLSRLSWQRIVLIRLTLRFYVPVDLIGR